MGSYILVRIIILVVSTGTYFVNRFYTSRAAMTPPGLVDLSISLTPSLNEYLDGISLY